MAKKIVLKIDEIESNATGNRMEIDSFVSSLGSHSHNDLYYTEPEIDTKLLDLKNSKPANLEDLTDFALASTEGNQVLSYDETNSAWVNSAPPAGDIAGSDDVDFAALADGQTVQWDATAGKWKAVDIPSGGGTLPRWVLATIYGEDKVDGHGLASIVFQGGGLYDAGTLGTYREKSVADDSEAFADTFTKSSISNQTFNSSDGTHHYELGVAHINWKYSFSSKSAIAQSGGSMPMSVKNHSWSNWCMAAHTHHIGLGETEANSNGQNHKYQYSGNSFSLLSLSAYDMDSAVGTGVVYCGGADGFIVRDHHVASTPFIGIWRFDPNTYSRSQITPPAGYETSMNIHNNNAHAATTPLTDGSNMMISGGYKTGKRKMYSVSGGAWSILPDNPMTGTQLGKGSSTGPVAFHQNDHNTHLYKHQFDTGAGAVELQNLCHSPVKWGAHMAAGT